MNWKYGRKTKRRYLKNERKIMQRKCPSCNQEMEMKGSCGYCRNKKCHIFNVFFAGTTGFKSTKTSSKFLNPITTEFIR